MGLSDTPEGEEQHKLFVDLLIELKRIRVALEIQLMGQGDHDKYIETLRTRGLWGSA